MESQLFAEKIVKNYHVRVVHVSMEWKLKILRKWKKFLTNKKKNEASFKNLPKFINKDIRTKEHVVLVYWRSTLKKSGMLLYYYYYFLSKL